MEERDFDIAMDLYKYQIENNPRKKISEMSKREFMLYRLEQSEIYNQVQEHKKIKGEEEMAEKNGIYNNKLTEKTPDWIICKVGIKVDELPEPNEKGFINIDICKSKDGSYYYPKLNEYGLKKQENIVDFKDVEINNDEVPF